MSLGGRPKEEGGHVKVKHSLNIAILEKLKRLASEQHKYRSKIVEEAVGYLFEEAQRRKITGMDRRELEEKLSRGIMQAIHLIKVGDILTELEHLHANENLSSLTAQEIVEKVNDFIKFNHKDEYYDVFLHFLAKYPVSMCKRKVSPTLKFVIGFYYRLSRMLKKEYDAYREVEPISMEELAEIFGRSKATIHECIKDTEGQWKSFLESKKREEEIEAEAKRELIEEAKERLRKDKQNFEWKNETDEETNERTAHSHCGRGYSP